MYNRYIPGSNGVYERQQILETADRLQGPPRPPELSCTPAETPSVPECPSKQPQAASGLDLGDLLLLCIILLLLLDADQEDPMTILITAAAFLFLQ